ncbi:hypothetical protein P3X46_031620 [Hevea brasiliensis]|uniref:Fe2OG dioxygenase domain-containing protein n=1 Tax=Hevea brasiliensis TaxID=3981 RepID=A0ABQ9KLU3_HEVBR|nr:hypothetical protein P3X46_031620 [Hevea brasiliensis]
MWLTKHEREISINSDNPPPLCIQKEISNPHTPLVPIPVIDISLLSSEEREDDELERLRVALTSWGCFRAIGHGIESSFLDKVREIGKQFFVLPPEEKQKFGRAANDLEGYGNDPNVSRKIIFNRSERILIKVAPEDQRRLERWPSNPSDFLEVLDEYSAIMKSKSRLLLRAMARSLNLEEDCFLNAYGDEELIGARFNYYPASSSSDIVQGAEPHSDGSGITILLQDKQVEGLQVLKDGKWSRVPIIPDALVVNVGDQMQIISNGIFKSPTHRVILESKKERIWVAVFHLPQYEVEIGPVQCLIDENRPQQYRNLKNYRGHYEDSLFQGKAPLEIVKFNAI